jgi:hypothetical protein
MASRNILSKRIDTEPIPSKEENKNILIEYFKNNVELIKHDYDKKVINKIIFINNKLKSDKILTQIKTKFKWVYKKLFVPYTNNITENLYNAEKCNNSIDNFFSLQYKLKNISEIISLIIYQYTFLQNVNNYLFVLSNKDNYYIHSEIYSDKNAEVDKNIIKYINDYIVPYNITYKPKNPQKEVILNKEDEEKLKFLEKVTQNIIKKIQKTSQEDFKIITYGSYTSYILNKNIQYNDIDIYHSNPLKFLIIIMMSIKFILNIETDIFKIPYILGHLSLRYKHIHFIDCIYIDKYTMGKIPTVNIENIIFIDPIVQMLNNFRMMSVIQRMHNISIDKDNTVLKYATLLNYSKKNMDLSFNFKKKLDINIQIINDDFFLINLKAMFQQKKEYKDFKHMFDFDYLIISLCKPNYFLKLINRDDILISKQYFALFNEIVVEILNKDKSELKKTEQSLENTINVNESKLNYALEPTCEKFPDILEKIIDENNVLIMTCISTDIYIKNHLSKEKLISNISVTNISKETILSSFVLYNTIRSKSSEVIKFYVEFLLNFLKYNDKTAELKLLANYKNNTPEEEFNNIYILKKIKLSGNHLIFTLKNPIYIKNLFFYKNQNQEYYNYKTFLEVTNYNTN